MDEELRFNPYEGIEANNLFKAEEPVNRWGFLHSDSFLDLNGHGDEFKPHPLAWDSIPYRSQE